MRNIFEIVFKGRHFTFIRGYRLLFATFLLR